MVLKYYLTYIRRLGFFLEVIRSNKGKETLLMAKAYIALKRVIELNLLFLKAYIFGPLTRNQRIKA